MSTPAPRPASPGFGSVGTDSLRMVALGGGHGLAASLSALRRLTPRLTAVVSVADDGGSSGRLRRELGVLPPGDLRMALAALCDDDHLGRMWRDVIQHRFGAVSSLQGHPLGNLLLIALLERNAGDPVRALDAAGELLRVRGRVLPMSAVPLEIWALVRGADPARPDAVESVRGQVAVATTVGHVEDIRLEPEFPPACPEAVAAVRAADVVVLGPGSWYTSVLPHLLVPELAAALRETSALRIVALNLAPQPGETEGFAPETHLDVLVQHARGLRVDVVLADPTTVSDPEALVRVARTLGASVRLESVASAGEGGGPGDMARHDAGLLADAIKGIVTSGASGPAGTASVEKPPVARQHGRTEGELEAWR